MARERKVRDKPKTKSLRTNWPGSFGFLALGLALLCLFLTITAFSYQIAFRGKIYPGVSVGGLPLGGKTFAQASLILSQHLPPKGSGILTIIAGGQTWQLPISEIDLSYNIPATARRAYKVGRRNQIFLDFLEKWQAATQGIELNFVYSLNQKALDKKVLELKAFSETPPASANLIVEGDKITLFPGRAGKVLNKPRLVNLLHQRFQKANFGSPILLPLERIDPLFDTQRAREGKPILESLLLAPLKLKFEENQWLLNAQSVLSFLMPIEATSSASPKMAYFLGSKNRVFASPLSLTGQEKAPLINQEAIKDYVEGLAREINIFPQNAVFHFEGGRVTVFRVSREGRELEINKTVELITQALNDLRAGRGGPGEIRLPVITVPPEVTTDQVNNLGIRELIGRGESNFRGSIRPRVENIALSASRLNGVLIGPGEIFSFNDALGEISARTGFKQAYVIKRGRTILDDGGGVCQVSTTLFRAALAAGLPIVERTAHAYRVVYYERASPVGFDATVYPPSVDLKFKNNTPGFILIQSRVDQKTSELVFDLYGTRDGRKVELGKPVITNQIPPPEPLYQEDPNRPRGEVKQIERPAWGATVYFSYKVTRNGEILEDQVFYSRYRPWGAVYLVGTKE